MVTIEDRLVGRDNNFNLLRLLAAVLVLVSHAWPLAIGRGAVEPLYAETGYKLGTTAVTVFFAVSGFFITRSFAERKSLIDFLIARTARIYPALAVALVITALVLGPATTTLTLSSYLAQKHSWTYVPANLSLFHLQWALPGVFEHNSLPGAVNGSLWTLYPEVRCYLLVILAGLIGLSRPKTFPLLLAIAVAAIFLVRQTEGGGVLATAATLTLPFAIGAGAYIYRRFFPLSVLLVAATMGTAAATRGGTVYPLTHAVALSYAALWFGFAPITRLRGFNRFGDLSYGTYIYAFPVSQVLVAAAPEIGPWALAAAALPATLLLAAASWRWIEAPALAHRHRFAAWVLLKRKRAGARSDVPGSDPGK